MSVYRINAIALVVSTSMLSCLFYKRNENYCEGRNKNNNCTEPPDPIPDAVPLSCPDEMECSGPTGVCNTNTGQCVQCTPGPTGNQAACTGNTPVCGADNSCRKCAGHGECPSNVCLPDGSCSADTPDGTSNNQVAYVEEGKAGANCTKMMPCGLISTALNLNRKYIKISGTIIEPDTIQIAQKAFTFLADTGAKLGGSGYGALVQLTRGASLTVYDLELFGATGTDPHAIFLPSGAPTLNLHHVYVHDNAGAGINASGGHLTIDRSTISANQGGGVDMGSPTTYQITNNFIVKNGDGFGVGGVQANPAGDSKLEFNTIVGNKANDVTAGGIVCSQANVSVPRNLVFDNIGSNAQTSIGCVIGDSKVSNPGANFRSATDYHLTANTPSGSGAIRDAVECSRTAKLIDIDGEDRPKNGMCDLGADEY